jgi:hypothetical protein
MAVTDPEFWVRNAFPVIVFIVVYVGVTAQSSVFAIIVNVFLLMTKAREIPRWLKLAATIVKNVHVVQFAVAAISGLLVVAYTVFQYSVSTLVFSMEFIGLMVVPAAIAMMLWESVTKRPQAERAQR